MASPRIVVRPHPSYVAGTEDPYHFLYLIEIENLGPGKVQLLVLRNATAGSLTATIDGNGGTTVNAPGLGVVSVAAGYPIVLAAGAQKAVVLSTISAYCQGVVSITGGALLKAQLFDI